MFDTNISIICPICKENTKNIDNDEINKNFICNKNHKFSIKIEDYDSYIESMENESSIEFYNNFLVMANWINYTSDPESTFRNASIILNNHKNRGKISTIFFKKMSVLKDTYKDYLKYNDIDLNLTHREMDSTLSNLIALGEEKYEYYLENLNLIEPLTKDINIDYSFLELFNRRGV